MKKRLLSAALLCALCLTLPACTRAPKEPAASGSASSIPEEPSISAMAPVEPAPEPEPEPLYRNPLTGEGTETDLSAARPVAVMVNNLKKALPQQGVSQADLIYEAVAEGGITRMLAVYQSVEGVGEIGSVRSARDYFVSLAFGHDAIFLHAGGSPMAYDAIQDWGVTALDCVNGPYEGTLFWRDPDRRKSMGYEHSVLTAGEKIGALLPTYKRVSLEHRAGYDCGLTFMGPDETAAGTKAERVEVTFSSYKTGVFTYDPVLKQYLVEEYGAPYIDGNTGEQVAVKNVLVLYTDISAIKGDDKGRQSVRVTGTGSGCFFCDGVRQEIAWAKKSSDSPMTYTAADGSPLKLGVGRSYINIVGGPSAVTAG